MRYWQYSLSWASKEVRMFSFFSVDSLIIFLAREGVALYFWISQAQMIAAERELPE